MMQPFAPGERRDYVPKQVIPGHPRRPERYRLRVARYVVLAQDINRWAGEAARAGRELSLLDVGCGWGNLLCQLEAEPNFSRMRISATDAFEHLRHKPHLYQEFFTGDLGEGHPEIASDGYDVVVCEQVLEHLPDLATALATLQRLVRPDGILVIGVPIFTPPLHLARRHLVPRFGHLVGHADSASHLQAFSLASFRRVLRHYPELEVVRVRGFRIVSGGLLRSLENYGWWWRFNRRLGELLPALCIEAQIILVKSPVPG